MEPAGTSFKQKQAVSIEENSTKIQQLAEVRTTVLLSVVLRAKPNSQKTLADQGMPADWQSPFVTLLPSPTGSELCVDQRSMTTAEAW
jgi:hypothetical protein